MQTQIEGFPLKSLLKTTSLAGWILLARPVIYLIFSRRRELEAYSAIDFSAIVFIIYAFVAFGVAYKVIANSETLLGNNIIWKSPIVWFIIYTVLSFFSMLWSINPILTGFRAFECLATALLIIAVIQDLFESCDLRYVILWSLMFCAWDALWSICRTLQWSTDLSNLLESSQMMATSFFFMALYFVPWKWYNWLVMILSVGSGSTVAYIGMAIGSISAFFTQGKTKILAIVFGFALLLTIVAIGPYRLIKDTVFYDKSEISIEETSGRNHLLDVTEDILKTHPMGMGFFAAEPFILYARNLGAISAHNSLFSAAFGMGYIGIVILSIFFIALWGTVFSKYIDSRYKAMLMGCLSVAFMHCMGNPSVGTRVFGAWIPCMYIFVLISAFYVYGKYYVVDETIEE